MNRAIAFTPERESGVHLRPRLRLEGTTVGERIVCYLGLFPGATTADIEQGVGLDHRPHAEMHRLKTRGLVRVEHGQVDGRGQVIARWWRA